MPLEARIESHKQDRRTFYTKALIHMKLEQCYYPYTLHKIKDESLWNSHWCLIRTHHKQNSGFQLFFMCLLQGKNFGSLLLRENCAKIRQS